MRTPRSHPGRYFGFLATLAWGAPLGACNELYWVCEAPAAATLSLTPERLSETGLYRDLEADILAQGVVAYRPAFELWSDGADKRRWLWLPKGTQIDTRDMDAWRFPMGTKVWKEFRRDGVRVETRLLHKTGPEDDDWVAMAYLWSADQHDAYAAPEGAIDAQGTRHNVPAAGECFACHGGTESRVLGVSAIQLSAFDGQEEGSLSWLADHALLSHPPEQPFEVPGNATEREALGYLHANCSHCHNQSRPKHEGARCYDPSNGLDFRLLVDDLKHPEDTQTYRTIGTFVSAGRPGASRLIDRVSDRNGLQRMPPLGTERLNQDAVALLRRWVSELERDEIR